MRQSVAPNRASSLNASGGSAAAQAKLIEKKKEYDAVAALERASALYLERIQGLADDCDVMANAGEVFGQVLAQWPRMFQVLNLFLASQSMAGENPGNPSNTPGERLVRLPIDELQSTEEPQAQPKGN